MSQNKVVQSMKNKKSEEPITVRSGGMTAAMVLGILGGSIAIGGSGMLVAQHFGAKLPGCGASSGCDLVTNSAWGRVPGLEWPMSFVGLALFVAMTVTFAVSYRRISTLFRSAAALGLLASFGFLWVMFAKIGKACPYCITAHVGNLLFVMGVELAAWCARRGPARVIGSGIAQMAVASLVFAVGTVAIVPFELNLRARKEQEAKAAADASLAAAIEKAATDRANAQNQTAQPQKPDKPNTNDTPTAQQTPVNPAVQDPVSAPAPQQAPLIGRHRRGPESAPIRIVAFFDYQCKDCKRVESEIEAVMVDHPEYSLSVKHFPMSSTCNTYLKGNNMHPNACWAARCAETAAILRGEDGFWAMHHWLFERGGNFTDAEIREALPTLGYDADTFLSIMQSQQPLSPVLEDIEDGNAYGLMYTPLIFVNGIELRGWEIPGNAPKWIANLAATQPPTVTAANDRPPLASQKYIDDWLARPRQPASADATARVRGAAAGPGTVEVILFGDYTDEFTARCDADIASAMAKAPNVRYTFRHYPWCQDCNPSIPRTVYPYGCRASRAAEAAAFLGGDDAYWKMHDWLLANQAGMNDAKLQAGAASLGLDGANLLSIMDLDSSGVAIEQDIAGGKSMGLRSMPAVWVDGRNVPRTTRDGDHPLERIILHAATAK